MAGRVLQNASLVWRGMIKAANLFQRGIRWAVGDGSSVLFLLDKWLSEQPLLIANATGIVPQEQLGRVVQHFWNPQFGWQLGEVAHLLPEFILVQLQQVQISGHSELKDRPIWSLSGDGNFSTKSLRQTLHPVQSMQQLPWKKLWKFCGPSRASLTLWTILHGALPTAELL